MTTIKAITICQPYAHLICLPDGDPVAKRVENRTWAHGHRGPLAIHAGKSRQWLAPEDMARWPKMVFGAVVAVADMVDCLRLGDIVQCKVPRGLEWVKGHPHTEGPWCWVLANIRRLQTPIPYAGAQGLWSWQAPADLETLLEPQDKPTGR